MKLLAPNGRPSNLTPKQYSLVRSVAFKKWFGDWENDPKNASKVVDENGEPMVVYHGSKSFDINEFDLSQSKRKSSGLKEFGTYFTDNTNLAKAYRNWGELKEDEERSIDFQIYKWEKILDESRNNRDYKNAQEQIERLEESKKGKIYGVFLNLKKIHVFDAKRGVNIEAWNNLEVKASYKWAKNRDAMEFLKEGKFGVEKVDGIKAENIVDAFVQTEELKKELLSNVYLVFDSKNIKLADGTNTTFDAGNPDIRFDGGGEIREIDVESIEVSDEIGYFDDLMFNELEGDEILEGFIIYYYHIKKIGLINIEDDKFELGVGYIWGLEVFEEYKGKGFGKKIMEKIFILHPTQYAFRGQATKKSKGFWLNLGAEFDESNEYSFILSKDKLNYSDGGNINDFKYTIGGL